MDLVPIKVKWLQSNQTASIDQSDNQSIIPSIACSSPNKDICAVTQSTIDQSTSQSINQTNNQSNQQSAGPSIVTRLLNIRDSVSQLDSIRKHEYLRHYFKHHSQSINQTILSHLAEITGQPSNSIVEPLSTPLIQIADESQSDSPLNEQSDHLSTTQSDNAINAQSVIEFFLFNDQQSLCENWLSLIQNIRCLRIPSSHAMYHSTNLSITQSNVAAFAALIQSHFVETRRLSALIRELSSSQSFSQPNIKPINHTTDTLTNHADRQPTTQTAGATNYRITDGMRESCITALVNLPALFANTAMSSSIKQSHHLSINQWNKTLTDASTEVLFEPDHSTDQSNQFINTVAQIFSKLTRLNHSSDITDMIASVLVQSLKRSSNQSTQLANQTNSSTNQVTRSSSQPVSISFLFLISRCKQLISQLNQLVLETFIASLVESLISQSFNQSLVQLANQSTQSTSTSSAQQTNNQSSDQSIKDSLNVTLALFGDFIDPQSKSLSSHIQYLFTNKFLVNQSVNHSVSFGRLIVRLLFFVSYGTESTSNEACHPRNQLFDQSINQLAKVWSSQSFVHNRSINQQQSYTAMLVEALDCLIVRSDQWLNQHSGEYRERMKLSADERKEQDERTMSSDRPPIEYPFSNHPLVVGLMDGIQSRMSNNQQTIRAIGMKIATLMSRLIDPTRPLQFDDEEEDRSNEPFTNHEASINKPANQLINQSTNHSITQSGNQAIDPVWNDDDRDLRKVPLPLHLRDALDLLRKQDEREPIESAMLVMEALIRRRPVDLPDLAAEIVSTLQQVATTIYSEGEIDLRRRLAMIAVVAICPLQTVGRMIEGIYGHSMTLFGKIEVLETLVAAAHELSGSKTSSKQSNKQSSKQLGTQADSGQRKADAFSPMARSIQALAIDAAIDDPHTISQPNQLLSMDDHAAVIARRVESRARRWGRPRNDAPRSNVNTFAMVAHEFFFPLINPVGRLTDVLLLMNVIDTASILVSLAAPSSPHLESMVASLLNVLMKTRLHDDPTIRRVSLVALIRIVATAPAHILFACRSSLHEISAWLVERQMRETDGDCAKLSLLAQQEMRNKFEALQDREIDEIRRSLDAPRDLIIPGVGTQAATANTVPLHTIKFM